MTMIKILTMIILILGCASVSFAQLEPKGALASIPGAKASDEDDEGKNEEAQEDERPSQADYKFPSPRKPGKRVGGVISNEKAEEDLEHDDDIRWDTNP